MMEHKKVESSTIRVIGYDAEQQLMEITFNSSATYRYTGVPKEVADAFLAADSKGSHFAIFIRANYPCERMHLESCGRYLDCHIPLCPCWCHRVRRDVTDAKQTAASKDSSEVPDGQNKKSSRTEVARKESTSKTPKKTKRIS